MIAATDSSGGAGLTRDVRVLTDFAIDALCVVTAVTAQTDKKVSAVHQVPPEVVRAQIAAALATREVGAIKIGMLGTQATVEAVVSGLLTSGLVLGGWPHAMPIVVDPVLVSTSGGVLLDAGGQAALTGSLFPIATLVTPNVPEAAAFLGEPVAVDEAELLRQGERLLGLGSHAILLKGGHPYAGRRNAGHRTSEDAVDILVSRAATGGRSPAAGASADGTTDHRPPAGQPAGALLTDRIAANRVAGSSRGTGCALASAIAAGLASGMPLGEACHAAKRYVLRMLSPAS